MPKSPLWEDCLRDRMSRLRAFELGEERQLAGVVAGLLWLSAAVTVAAMMTLPGIPHDHWRLVVVDRGRRRSSGASPCLTLVPWERVHPIVSHLSCFMGFPATAVGVYATGGTDSPAHLYLFFIVGYCAYFYAAREAIPYLVGCIVVTALPLLYDPDAIDGGFFVAEVLILAPTYCILGGFILAGKTPAGRAARACARPGAARPADRACEPPAL